MKAHQRIIKDNAKSILKTIAKYYGVEYSTVLYKMFREHPDFPSFLSIQYMLERMGKDSFAIQTGYEEMTKISGPFIIHVITNVELFLFVTKVVDGIIYIINEKGNEELMSTETLMQIWDGYILIIDDKPGDIKFTFRDTIQVYVENYKYSFLIICVLCLFVYAMFAKKNVCFDCFLYYVAIVSGLIVSLLLFMVQLGKSNKFIKRICSSKSVDSKVDCSSILDFKDAYFMGLVSWSDIGLVYFIFLFFIWLFLPIGIARTLINCCSLFSIGYCFYSVIYQKYIAKKWCSLCLIIQLILAYLFILSICYIRTMNLRELRSLSCIVEIVLILGLTISLYISIKSLIVIHVNYSSMRAQYNKLIYDDNIMHYLLNKEQYIKDINQVTNLFIGNVNAKTSMTLIFSPTCVSCIKDLQILLPILHRKKNLRLDLIFLMDKIRHPDSVMIAKFLLNQYYTNHELFLDALQKYVSGYPVSKNKILRLKDSSFTSVEYEKILYEHEKWCGRHKLYFTPIIYLNGNRLPSCYKLQDIDYLYS